MRKICLDLRGAVCFPKPVVRSGGGGGGGVFCLVVRLDLRCGCFAYYGVVVLLIDSGLMLWHWCGCFAYWCVWTYGVVVLLMRLDSDFR